MNYKIPDCVPVTSLQKLVAAMIAQAVEDFRKKVFQGKIVGGNVVEKHFHGVKKMVDIKDTRDLIHFFRSKTLDDCITSAGLNIAADKIRSALPLG